MKTGMPHPGHNPITRPAGIAARGGSCAWCLLCWLLAAGPLVAQEADTDASAWKPAAGPLFTRWAAGVSPTNVHPEYPRPQLRRERWLNLNGLWDYAVLPSDAGTASRFDGKILVPFPIESALSGVMQRLDEDSTLWYRRTVAVPAEWRGGRVRLHFGAVDWRTRVTVNQRLIGEHRGGYDSFSFDVTDSLMWNGREEIVVAVEDPTEGDQPRGKQARKQDGIFYTPTSGIWQTVWMEPVPAAAIDGIRCTPDLAAPALRVRAEVGSEVRSLRIEVAAFSAGKEVARTAGSPNEEIVLSIPSPQLWTPEDPFLYDLSVVLKDGERIVDSVSSYFGMREVALRRDAGGAMRIELNGRFVFQVGALDQGFWPDGLYTAPTDEALRFDVEFLKRCGFNLVRKHVKIEPERWYYWCDKLGLLVWQDMPSGNNNALEGRTQFEVELQRMVRGLRNHPSLIMWVLFNEGWGQYDTERLTAWLKSADPSRLVNNASGWTDKRVGDVMDVHSYPGPEAPPVEAERAGVLGEFGGLGFGWTGHTWSDRFWGYQQMPDQQTLVEKCSRLLERIFFLRNHFGLSAAVYTQTTDVETECNGLLTYDRAIAKIDPAILREALSGKQWERQDEVVAANALHGRVLWKFTTEKPADGWALPAFNDSGWAEGLGGFGTRDTPNTLVNTSWASSDIWLRREFRWDGLEPRQMRVQIHHDEDAEVYINGVLALRARDFVTSYVELPIEPDALAALKPGVNVIAVHCHQNRGGQYIDAGIIVPVAGKPAAAVKP